MDSGAIATLIAAMLALPVAFFAGRWQQRATDRDRRRIVAMALLLEIRSIDRLLRRWAGYKYPAKSTLKAPLSLYERFEGDLVLFSPDTAHDVLLLYGLLRDVQAARQTIRKYEKEEDARANYNLRVKLISAANIASRLHAQLVVYGSLPSSGEYAVYQYPDLPSLSPSAFSHPAI